MIIRGDLTGLTADSVDPSSEVEPSALADVEKRHIKACLDRLDWNMSLTAEKLGIHRNTLRAKIKEYTLSRD
jgi:DNA-binding NtrC family response regulator